MLASSKSSEINIQFGSIFGGAPLFGSSGLSPVYS
jgi:hypothetical protein